MGKNYKMSVEEKSFLASYDASKYDNPSLTADIAVFAILTDEKSDEYRKDPEQRLGVLLVKRGNYPYKDCWAVPGGFAAKNETLNETALRELKEETGVDSAFLEPFGIFSAPGRDPRGWIVSQGYMALVDVKKCNVMAGSDAGDAAWFTIDVTEKNVKKSVSKNEAEIIVRYEIQLASEVPGTKLKAVVDEIRKYSNHHETVAYDIVEDEGIAFDHAEIIVRAYKSLHERAEDAGRIVFDMMPEKFTLYSLQEAYEIILGEKLITPNFRRKIAPFVTETDEVVTGVGHRPAKLFKRNLEAFYSK